MKNFLAFFIITLISLPLLAQTDDDKKVIKKEKRVVVKTIEKKDTDDKVVTVDVMKDGETGRKIKIKLKDNGDGEVIEWSDDGTIPDEIKKKLEEKGVDIHILESGDKSGKNVWITDDGMKMEIEKDYVFIMGDDDEVIEFEWDGEGEMPEGMKEMMGEHDVDIDLEDDCDKKIRMKMIKKGDHKGPHKMHKRHSKDHTWVEKRNMNFSAPLGNAYMGAQIESADEGVRILDVMVDSPSHKGGLKKGDIVTEVNGANTKSMENLLTLLSFFDPNDEIEVKYLRDGKERKAKITLAKRPDSYR